MAATLEQVEPPATRFEGKHLESGLAASPSDFENLADYCTAVANEGGGQIFLGEADEAPRSVEWSVPVEDPRKTAAGIHDRLGLKVRCEEVQYPSGRVFMLHVPSRPRGQAVSHKGRFLIRAGEHVVPMPVERLRKIFSEDELDWDQVSAMTRVDSDLVIRLLDTQSYFILLEASIPTTHQAVLDRFAEEGFVRNENRSWTITNLGAILFARNLGDFERLGRKSPRVTVFDGNSKLRTTHDRFLTKGYAVGFDEFVGFVNGLIPHKETIGPARRREVKRFPEVAVSELIANALIHQDFAKRGMSVDVGIFDDRMEVSSPGTPTIPTERFLDKVESRNERLSNLMRQFGHCGEKGMGIDRVVSATETHHLPPPEFRASANRTTAILFSHKEFRKINGRDRIRAAYQHCSLRHLQNERMTNQSLRERFELPQNESVAVSQVIKAAIKTNKIKREAPLQTSAKHTHYLPFWA